MSHSRHVQRRHTWMRDLKLEELELVRYEPIYPICQANHTAKSVQPQWRCVACLNAGLEGNLIIQSQPIIRETLNA